MGEPLFRKVDKDGSGLHEVARKLKRYNGSMHNKDTLGAE